MWLSQTIYISIMHMPYVVIVFVNDNLRWDVIIRLFILVSSVFKLSVIFQWKSYVFWVESNLFIYYLLLSLATEDLYVEPDKWLNSPNHPFVPVSINHVNFNRAILLLLLCSRIKRFSCGVATLPTIIINFLFDV